MDSTSSDPYSEGPYLEIFQALTTENCFLPIFAEAYTQLLLKSSEPDQAEEFIRKLVSIFFLFKCCSGIQSMYCLFRFVECESKNSGLLAPLQAIGIVKLHMIKNEKLICDLLHAVAEKDSGHPLVMTN